ncbi:MAG TPA: septum formation initiator family protein [Candidatus Nanopelagicaceae bacterium]
MFKSISGRSLAFATVLLILAITIAPPLHNFFEQRVQINAYRAELAASESTLAAAEKELTLWNDPTYVASQARIRLHYVFPGEREYIVLNNGLNNNSAPPQSVPVAPLEGVVPTGTPWYSKLITTITSTNPSP